MSIQAIRELRERTYLGMTECKSALDEAQGDVEKAVEILQKRGSLKKVDPLLVPREGAVKAIVVNGVGKIAELNCQTDFAARSELFQKFMDRFFLSDLDREDLLKDYFTKNEDGQLLCKQLGEKVVLKRYDILWVDKLSVDATALDAIITRAYNHHSGKIAVLISIGVSLEDAIDNSELIAFADELAMQVAANNPLALYRSGVPADVVSKQLHVFESQVKGQMPNKPQQMIEKIINGKMDKWYQENCLMEQESIIYPKKRLTDLSNELRKKIGADFVVGSFIRYELGA